MPASQYFFLLRNSTCLLAQSVIHVQDFAQLWKTEILTGAPWLKKRTHSVTLRASAAPTGVCPSGHGFYTSVNCCVSHAMVLRHTFVLSVRPKRFFHVSQRTGISHMCMHAIQISRHTSEELRIIMRSLTLCRPWLWSECESWIKHFQLSQKRKDPWRTHSIWAQPNFYACMRMPAITWADMAVIRGSSSTAVRIASLERRTVPTPSSKFFPTLKKYKYIEDTY